MAMDIQEFVDNLNNLDPENIGSWPISIKIFIWILTSIAAGFLVYYLILADSLLALDNIQKKESDLMKTFEDKAFQAANLERLKKQMQEMENSFGALVKQLPEDTEVPGLLEDISQLGLDSGLEFDSIGLGDERVVEFYAELPIEIHVRGGYHAFGGFVSGVAALPRIVTLHDFQISPAEGSDSGQMSMIITAKTYRYNDGEEEE